MKFSEAANGALTDLMAAEYDRGYAAGLAAATERAMAYLVGHADGERRGLAEGRRLERERLKASADDEVERVVPYPSHGYIARMMARIFADHRPAPAGEGEGG